MELEDNILNEINRHRSISAPYYYSYGDAKNADIIEDCRVVIITV